MALGMKVCVYRSSSHSAEVIVAYVRSQVTKEDEAAA
jgi:hypothetical protein